MADYIERDAVVDLITRRYENPEICTQEINSIPAAAVAPVVHGRWIYKHRHRGGIRIYEGKDEMGETRRISVDERYEIDDPYCSECGKLNESVWLNYCPHCGAEMDDEPCTTQ